MLGAVCGCKNEVPSEPKPAATTEATTTGYTFERSYPSGDTAQKAYDNADLSNAITAYKLFYPTVSIAATWKGNAAAGLVTNRQFMILEGSPKQFVFTPNSDTEDADMNQRYVMDN